MLLKALSDGGDLHAFKDGGHAGGKELGVAFDFDDAEAAGADIAESLEVTKGGNFDVVFAGHFKDGLAGAGADFVAIDYEGFDFRTGAHANTSKVAALAAGA